MKFEGNGEGRENEEFGEEEEGIGKEDDNKKRSLWLSWRS